MRILELFSGTESFSKVAEARGHQGELNHKMKILEELKVRRNKDGI